MQEAVQEQSTERIEAPRHIRHWLLDMSVISALALAVYANTFTVPFYFDDANFILRNPFIRDLSNFLPPFDRTLMPGPVYELTFSRFVGFLSFALNYSLHGLSITGYHVANFIIHVANSLVLYAFVRLLYRVPGLEVPEIHSRTTAFAVALLFSVHPVQTQAVTYIGQRFASLVALFYLGALLFYLFSRLSSTRTRAVFFLAISLVFCLLAMRTKENAFTLPFAVLALEMLVFSGPLPKRLLRAAAFLPLLAVIPLSIFATTGSLLAESVHTHVYSSHDYLATQARVLLTYIRLTFFPINQTLDYEYPVFRTFTATPVLASIAVLAALLTLIFFVVIRAGRDRRTFGLPAFGMLFFFLSHSVESSFVSIPEIISEHRMYLPLAGFLLAVGSSATTAAFRIWDRKTAVRLVLAATLVLGALFSAATLARNALWNDTVAFWDDAVAKAPGNWRALTYLGEAYLGREEYLKAVDVLERASNSIRTNRLATASTYVSLGQAYMKLNAYDKALASYEKAAAIFPTANTFLQLAEAQWESGRREQARATAQRTVDMDPEDPSGHNVLGLMLAFDERYDEAFAAFERALKLDPAYDTARYNRALTYLEEGDIQGAEEDYRALQEIGSPFAAPLEDALRQFRR